MRISYNWLKKYVDIKLPPEKLKKLLTMSGLSVESLEKTQNDSLFEIEVTSNRPDWLSVMGVAREVAALTGKKLKTPSIPQHRGKDRGVRGQGRIVIKIEEKYLCPKYTGRVIRDIKVGESPAWLKERLEAMGLRSINNIVDITNFCLFETGEPLHAFDLDRLEGGKVIVRAAHNGERLVTIDGVERNLDGSMIVIADAVKPIALAGIMGGLATEVTASTKNILLEAASFEPISIRRASRKLALSTESSYRFERKVAIENIVYSSDRAAGLILELAGGEIGEFVDIGEKVIDKRPIEFNPSRASKLIGIDIPPSRVKNILTTLGMKIKSSSKGSFKITVPEFRNDLKQEVDITEEVARVYGYDKVPETIPAVIDQPIRMERGRIVERNLRYALTACGATEVVNYSLVSRKMLAEAMLPSEETVEIRNPLSGEQGVMRSSLLPGMLNSVLWNLNRKNKDLKLFEIGNVYTKKGDDLFTESKRLAIAITGEIVSGWASPSRPATFYDLKGVMETVLRELGIKGGSFAGSEDRSFSPAERASIKIDGETIGIIGEIAAGVTGKFDIKTKVYFCQVNLADVTKYARLEKEFKGLCKYPSVMRDISILVDKNASYAELVSSVTSSAGPLLKNIELVDRYTGKQIPDGMVGLTCRLEYEDLSRTLEEKDVQDAQARVLAELKTKFGARLR